MKKNNLNQTFGSYIRDLRTDLKIGQRELAQKIKIAGSLGKTPVDSDKTLDQE